MKNEIQLPEEPLKPKDLINVAVHSAAHSSTPISGSAWLIDDKKHREYYIGFRVNGKSGSLPTGILKRPERDGNEASKKIYEVNKLLAQEIVLKANQILKTHISVADAQEQISSIVNRAMAAACGLSFVQFAVTWVRPRVLAKGLSLSVVELYCRAIDLLAAVLKQAGIPNALLGAVTGKHVALAMSAFATASPSTFNKYLSVYRALFNEAISRNYLALNPAREVKYRSGKSIERLPFSLGEIEAIFAAMDRFGDLGREWKIASFLSLNLGARRGDVLKRTWGEFDLTSKTLKFKPGKNQRYDRELTLPLSNPLYELLTAVPKGEPDKPVCPTLEARQGSALCKSFNVLLRRAGIEVPKTARDDGTGWRAVTQKSFYGFRHTLNLWLEVAGVPREKRKDMLGQTTDKAQEVYRHKKAEGLRKELEKVPHLKTLLGKFAETASEVIDYSI